MRKILVVDDNLDNIVMIQKYGQANSYEVYGEVDSTRVLNRLKNEKFDIIILDVMMDKLTGFDLALEIVKNYNIKIIFLSAKVDIASRIKGLELGAIDYITKPFSLEELFLKINNILNLNKTSYEFKIDDLVFNIKDKKLKKNNNEVKLTSLCFDLLLELCQNSGYPLSRKYLLETIWGTQEEFSSRTVDAHIVVLRNKLKEVGTRIKTVRGKGYMYEKDEE